MPNQEPKVGEIYGEEFDREQLFQLQDMMQSGGWAQLKRILVAWKNECYGNLLIREDLLSGFDLGDVLKVVSGRAEMLERVVALPADVKAEWDRVTSEEDEA